jgi:hypothetical protein
VAGSAFDRRLRVFITQNEAGFVMLEAGFSRLPVALRMAISALGPQRFFVFVVLFVTPDTVTWRLFKHHTGVAVFTNHIRMLAQQRKLCKCMVKLGWLFPIALGVAGGTFFAERLFVLVVFLMA